MCLFSDHEDLFGELSDIDEADDNAVNMSNEDLNSSNIQNDDDEDIDVETSEAENTNSLMRATTSEGATNFDASMFTQQQPVIPNPMDMDGES